MKIFIEQFMNLCFFFNTKKKMSLNHVSQEVKRKLKSFPVFLTQKRKKKKIEVCP